ncbi:hypothetical protein [Caulobacter sp. UNC279MFTsu5.1]|uniref:hypothetical protein n=1 Tax=Caulobacter sp. UNC279MFTsu5.1 TaxID=1502775 RepID=UPI0008EF918D|nr:hypothetical protein [Caulobacter sp. UNC279MFTsu5.1]SFI81987.1 hypothetical protein SAMN02799626_00590 [Caulobacter sp. UNC279MFTsu5.1]
MLKVACSVILLALACGPAVAGGPARHVVRPEGCAVPKGDQVQPAEFGATECFPSPDGRKLVVVRGGRISVDDGVRTTAAGVIDYGRLIWNPASTGFIVSDNAGSGQTSYLSYVDLRQSSPHRIKALRWTAAKQYVRRFKCGGPGVYVHSWFDSWQDADHARIFVIEGVHSEGCRYPEDGEIGIGVVGDPVTGRIDKILTETQARTAWCTPGRRDESALCNTAP